MEDDVRVDDFVAVLAKRDFVVAQHRILIDAVVRARAEVLSEAREEDFCGLYAATDRRLPFEDE